ncbi:acyl-CoA dehydrogenase family protein [Streptomyces sp. NPDC051018]|uniref:acyl-CoA dehydrogenase family protein n=1 Tax=Streptomyces sp. NPDC051018 TaxID=3365639 RepID=UPI00378BB170
MDFTPTEEQAAARDLAARVFGDLATPDRLSSLGTGSDAELWKTLCATGLMAAIEDIGLLGLVLLLEEQGRTTAQTPFAVSAVHGLLAVTAHGTDEQRARLLPGLRDGTVVATGALGGTGGGHGAVRAVVPGREAAPGRTDGGGTAAGVARPAPVAGPPGGARPARGALTGTVGWVPWLRDATHVLVADAERALWWVRVADAETAPVETTAPWSAGRLVLDGTPAERLGEPGRAPVHAVADVSAGAVPASTGSRTGASSGTSGKGGTSGPGGLGPASGDASAGSPSEAPPGGGSGRPGAYEEVLAMGRIAFAGLQAGVCAGSLARAVQHTSTREQFGRPLSTNQGVLLRAADAYMDTEAIRVTAYEAAWRYDEGLPFATHALTAAWWASEAGTRVVHAGQHLHGGLGADLDHPVHRHFLWGRQLDMYLGCGSEVLAELGALLAKEGTV